MAEIDPSTPTTAAPVYVVPPTAKQLRQKLLAHKATFNQEILKLELDGEPITVVVREPTKAERSMMFKSAGVENIGTDGDGNAKAQVKDMAKLEVWGVIYCTRSESGDRIFEAGDLEQLMSYPSGRGFVEAIAGAVGKLMGSASAAGKT